MASMVAFPTGTPSNPRGGKDPKDDAELTVSKQIDELQRLAEEERDRQLGPQWFREVKQFYALTGYSASSAPTFRPRVIIPELQTMMLAEATDISESSPKVFILNKGQREKERERAFQEHWRQQQYNFQLFLGVLWALFCGTGFMQVGFDPEARRGRGEIWLNARDPSTVAPDPGILDREHWIYCILWDKLYLDEICRQWPEPGARLRRKTRGYVSARIGPGDDSGPGGLSLPEGPMRYGSGGVPQQQVIGDGRLIVRQLYINDYSTEELSKEERARVKDALGPLGAVPRRKLKFPHGRWIGECEGVTLWDGDFWTPFKQIPVIPLHAMPPLHSLWVPPPVRYSKSLQELGERMYTGVFENGVRLNNGTWFIDERTGLDPFEFGGLPAEIRVINAGSPPPEVKYGQPMPAHFTQLPELLLQKQRLIHGFSPMRSGQPAAGNIAQDLFDASVFQSQVLTRMRSKLLAQAVQPLAELIFYSMMRYYRDPGRTFPGFGGGDQMEMVPWKAASQNWEESYDVYLEPGSLRPLSASFLRSLVMMLLGKGQMPLEDALNLLDIPDAESIAERRRQELELAAMSKQKRPR